MIFEKHGELVPESVLMEISRNYRISAHALARMKERGVFANEIRQLFQKPFMAYYNTDGTINIAEDETHYFVISKKNKYGKYTIITYKEPSIFEKCVSYKRCLALQGKERREHKENG